MLEAPADDMPRLIYADWLEDQGDPLAEFVRVGVALAPLGSDAAGREELEHRRDELLRRHGAGWLGPWLAPGNVSFHRGFVSACQFPEGLTASAARELASRRVFALLPLARGRLEPWHKGLAVRVRVPGLGALRQPFWLGAPLGDALGAVLLGSPHLAGATDLDLGTSAVGDAAVAALAANPALAGLLRLDLGCRERPPGWSGLPGPPLVGPEGLRALAGAAFLVNLRRLSLAGSPVGEGVTNLLASPHFPALRALNLRDTGLDSVGVYRLANAPFVERLEELELTLQEEPAFVAAALAGSPHLKRIRYLRLRADRRLPRDATRVLRRAFGQRVRLD
jgi:uncharacterized protein (TIGR02996 family)